MHKFLKGHVGSVPRNIHVKFEVPSFKGFGAISIYRPKILGVT